MIIANLMGGLGNQMFQYATATSIAQDLKLPVKFCIDSYSGYSLHNGLELNKVFDLNLPIATTGDYKKAIGFYLPYNLRTVLSKFKITNRLLSNFVSESSALSYKDITGSLIYGGYLHGYWQNQNYFRHNKSIIKSHFKFSGAFSNENSKIVGLINESESVSLHIRRGDYIDNVKTNFIHGVIPLSYYIKCIKFLEASLGNIKIFVFSDDLPWAQNALGEKFSDLVYVDNNIATDSFLDMRLMSFCKHNIIANSTFSWWGAWLNSNPNKIVIGPKNWFAKHSSPEGLFENNWISFE